MVNQSKNLSGILVARQFDSFEEFSEIAVGWNTDFRQLDAERYQPDMFQAQIGSILISGAHFGCHVNQRGETPGGMRTFAIPDVNSTEMRWFGHVTGPDVLLAFPTHGEIEVYSKPGLGVATFSIPENMLSDFFQQNGGPDPEKVLGSSEKVIRAPHLLLNKIRRLYRQLQNTIVSNGASEYLRVRHLEIQEQILACLLMIIESIKSTNLIARRRNRHKLNRLLELINYHAAGNYHISDLYSIAQVPERTAQELFKREIGMTPNAYLIGQRMYAAHRELWQANPSKAYVSDIANSLGFWHMGQFAADYRKVFGELPSTTLNRAA